MVRKFGLAVICFALVNGFCKGQTGLTPCNKARQVVDALSNHHIQPPSINDVWSEHVFDEFLYLLDPGKRFLTVEDTLPLEYKTQLDDALKDKNCALIDKAAALKRKKLEVASLIITSYLKSPLDYSKNESLSFSITKASPLPANQKALEEYWKRLLKLQMLVWMSRNSDTPLDKLSLGDFKKLEASAREIIKAKEQGLIARLLNPQDGFEKTIETAFLKSVAHSYDPHTEYFTTAEYEDFNLSLSATGLSFGLEIEEDRFGQIKISRLFPGGSAWLSNELNLGDVLIRIKWGTEEPVDIMLYDLDELERDLNSSNKHEVTVTVKKVTGQIKTTSLVKTKIELNENSLKSFLLKGETAIGYISLPGFYTQFEDQNKGCADDVARELIKLKKEKIEGLILDLRLNGGGSLYEALALAGIFVDAGPLALIQETGQPVVTLKDINRGTIYDGPLLILVNGFSASASELVSAVLQDLNRAIIVGKQTYGKATGQVVMPIDINSRTNAGFLKVTNDRIYRVTGKSLQRKGVVPDIILPDILDPLIERERDFKNALAADSVIKKAYYTPLSPIPIKELKTKSETRIITSKSFENIKQAESIFSQPIPLELKKFNQYNQTLDTLFQSVSNSDHNNLYKVQMTHFDDPLLSMDKHRKETREEVLKEIQHSPYIEEAYRILLDYISLTKLK